MKNLLLFILLLSIIVGLVTKTDARAGKFFDKLLYPSGITHAEHEITIQNTWSWSKNLGYSGFLVSASDLNKFARFHLEFSISDRYTVSESLKPLQIPEGVHLIIDEIGELDISGTEVGSIMTTISRKEYVLVPALSIPLYQKESVFKVRKGLQIRFEDRLGFGYEIRNHIDESRFEVKILQDEDAGEVVTIPLTGTGSDNGIVLFKSVGFDLGVIHTEVQAIYVFPKRIRGLIGVGARW